jgi:hypothetical protein
MDCFINKRRLRIDVGMSWNGPYTKFWMNSMQGTNLMLIGAEPNVRNIDTFLGLKNFDASRYPHPLPAKESRLLLSFSTSCVQVKAAELYYRFDDFILLPFALGKENKDNVPFFCTSNDPGTSSMYKPSFPNAMPLDQVNSTRLRRLDYMLQVLDEPVDIYEILKIDAQGSDFDILQGTGEFILNFCFVQFEKPPITQYQQVVDYLADAHFYLVSKGFEIFADLQDDRIYINSRLDRLVPSSYIFKNLFVPEIHNGIKNFKGGIRAS